MFRAPSLQHEYTLVFSGDPALSLPEDEKERENALRVARETGAWHSLCHASQLPTLFKLRPLPHSAYEWLIGESVRRNLTMPELCTLAVRLALRGVDNFDGLEFGTVRDGEHVLAKSSVTDTIADVGREIGDPNLGKKVIAELGSEIMRRAQEGISPKR